MSKEKWIESLLDEMVESQWSRDIILQEYEKIDKEFANPDTGQAEELEPISRFSDEELDDLDEHERDFKSQIDNFSKTEYEDYLISQAVSDIRDEDYFEEIEFSDDYLENLIRQHLAEEKNFLDMVMKEAIAEEGYFQEYVEEHFRSEAETSRYDYQPECGDVHYAEYPVEKEVFDDLGDTSYMDQGIFEGANTDRLEEPFTYMYYEQNLFDEGLFDFEDIPDDDGEDEFYRKSEDYVDIADVPDDLILEEPSNDNLRDLICERLFEEKYLDKIFVEIIKRDEYWDKIIREKLAGDEKLNQKLTTLG